MFHGELRGTIESGLKIGEVYKNGIFDDNDREIATNVYRKVKTVDEINKSRENRKKNDARF